MYRMGGEDNSIRLTSYVSNGGRITQSGLLGIYRMGGGQLNQIYQVYIGLGEVCIGW